MKKLLFTLCLLCLTSTAYAVEYKPYIAGRAAYTFMNNDANQWVSDRGYTSTIVNKTLEDNVWGC